MHFILYFILIISSPLIYADDIIEKDNTYEFYIENTQDIIYDKHLFIGASCGYGFIKTDKNYCGTSIISKVSKRIFLGIEALIYKAKHLGNIYHKNNSIIGQNTSYLSYILFGLRLKPRFDLVLSPYFGVGSSINYSKILSIASITAGIEATCMLSQYLSFSIGYKNISFLLKPTIDTNHFITSNIQISIIQ
jgi:hypothetical protein